MVPQIYADITYDCPYLTLSSSVSWILSRRKCRKDLIFCCPDRESRYSDEQRTHRIGRLSLILQQPTQPSVKGEEEALMRLQELQKGKACSNPSPSHTLLLPSPLQGQMLISESLPKILQILLFQKKTSSSTDELVFTQPLRDSNPPLGSNVAF